MKISKESWHYRLFSTYANGNRYDLETGRLNFCQYSRSVMGGFLMTLVVVVAGVLIGTSMLQLVPTILLGLFTDNGWMWFILPLGPDEGGSLLNIIGLGATVFLAFEMVMLAVLVVLGVMVGIRKLYRSFREKKHEDYAVAPDGFIVTWYKSKKEKFCPVVTMDPNGPAE